jgi:hypothetical protein
MFPDLHPYRLESSVKSLGILRYDHILGETNATCRYAGHNRNMPHIPGYSMVYAVSSVNSVSAGGDRNHNFLQFPIFQVGYPNFIMVEYQVGRTTLHRLIHIAYRFFKKDSQNLQTRFFLWETFLFGQLGNMT